MYALWQERESDLFLTKKKRTRGDQQQSKGDGVKNVDEDTDGELRHSLEEDEASHLMEHVTADDEDEDGKVKQVQRMACEEEGQMDEDGMAEENGSRQTSGAGGVTVDTLPAELWQQVFAHLDHIALAHTVSLVCWDWYELANSNAPWRGAFQRKWRIRNTPEGPNAPTWKDRFKNLFRIENNWRSKTRKQTTMKIRCGKVMMLDFDDRYLVSASEDGTVRMWDFCVENGECKATKERILRGHHRWVNCVQLDHRWLASGADDMAIKLWDITSPDEASSIEESSYTLLGHTGAVLNVRLQPSNGLLASCSADKSIICWDMETRQPMQRLRGHLDGVRGLSISEDGNIVVSGSYDKSLKVWDRRAATSQRMIYFKGPVSSLHLIDNFVAVGTYAGEVHLYDFPSLTAISTGNRQGRVWCVQYDPVRDMLVSSMTWVRTDWPGSGTYAIEPPLTISTDGINSFKFSENLLISGGYAEITMSNYAI